MMLAHGQSALGLAFLLLLAFALSENRRRVALRPLAAGIALQFALALLLLRFPGSRAFFQLLNDAVSALQQATAAGTSFVFGYLGGGPLPFAEKEAGLSFVLALQALPLVLVVSALSSLLFYWRILPAVVRGFAWLLRRSLGVGGPLGVGAAANIFVGMIEAPLFIRPYLERLTRSELFAVMTCGMATVAGTVMVLYASVLRSVISDAMGHILIASIISAPAALVVARLMVPEENDNTEGDLLVEPGATSSMDAIVQGAGEGVKLLIGIIAMLIVFVALISLVNIMLAAVPWLGPEKLSLQRLMGYVMAPVVWLVGIPAKECVTAGALMGTKTVLNEFIAYLDLLRLPTGALSPRSQLLMLYAMCGFANFGSLGIMIGGMGAAVPERRTEIVSLAMKSLVAGTLATCMTGAVVGVLL